MIHNLNLGLSADFVTYYNGNGIQFAVAGRGIHAVEVPKFICVYTFLAFFAFQMQDWYVTVY